MLKILLLIIYITKNKNGNILSNIIILIKKSKYKINII